uniref:Uncharacterized protein n=1 Tax=Micrurus surinamensis TaxID=129470 RepID=A0A2D4NQX8_MICSU
MGYLNLAHGTGLEIAKDQPMVLLVAKTGHGGAMCRPPLGPFLAWAVSCSTLVAKMDTRAPTHPILASIVLQDASIPSPSPPPPKKNYSAGPALEKIQFDTSDLAHKIEEDHWLPLQAAILVMTH